MANPKNPVKATPAANAVPPKFFTLIPKTNIDFISIRWIFYGLSLFLVLGTVGLLIARGGPNVGVDFKGGIAVQLDAGAGTTIDAVRREFASENLDATIQTLGEPGLYMAKLRSEAEEQGVDLKLEQIVNRLAPGTGKVLSKEFVGAVVGEKLRYQALMAIGLSFLGIIIYVGFRFRNFIWGVAGVAALVHDVIVAFGFITLLGYEIDLTVVAALMTLAGYSINDTVVIFDRLRERIRLYPRENLREAINGAVNETMSRNAITAGLTFLAVLALAVGGGMHLRPFAVALLVGVIVGSYSTFGVASNLVYAWSSLTGARGR